MLSGCDDLFAHAASMNHKDLFLTAVASPAQARETSSVESFRTGEASCQSPAVSSPKREKGK